MSKLRRMDPRLCEAIKADFPTARITRGAGGFHDFTIPIFTDSEGRPRYYVGRVMTLEEWPFVKVETDRIFAYFGKKHTQEMEKENT